MPRLLGPAGSRFLDLQERITIFTMLENKQGIRAIARALERSPSTISREVRRNSHPRNRDYRPNAAQRRSDPRRLRPKTGKIDSCSELRDFIQNRLLQEWSPEQISNTLRTRFPERSEMNVVHETIYQGLYRQGDTALRRKMSTCLRTGRAVRKPQRSANQRSRRFFDPMLMIDKRPAEVKDRAVPGHWEGDLITGSLNQSAIGTLVERTTRYVMLVHLPDNHEAETVRDGILNTMAVLPAHLRKSLTWDQGCELARHKDITQATGMAVFFCDPASPWQRGSNENTNGLLRQYFPKGSHLSRFSLADLQEAAKRLNNRPRKMLGWETPADRLAALLGSRN
jgi:IS30 family transposase